MLKNICILRLSALGDVINCLPSVRAIQKTYPKANITWIIGITEYQLVKDINNINFVVVNKNKFIKSWFLLRTLSKFDVVLHMQVSFRASLFQTALRSKRTIGFDKNRSKDLQNLFCSELIEPHPKAHTLENHLDFAKAIGAKIEKLLWNLPLDKMQSELKKNIILPEKYIVISPCASKKIRNLSIDSYAKISQQITKKYGLPCILTGGKTPIEQHYSQAIEQLNPNIINLIGKTTIRQMTAIIANAQFVIAPDSGPLHIATATNTKVIGLYASSDPNRTGPYLSQQWVVNRYPQAIKKYLTGNIIFGTRVKHPEVMQLISVASVMQMVEKILK